MSTCDANDRRSSKRAEVSNECYPACDATTMIRCIDSASGLVPIKGANNGGVVGDGAPGEGSVQPPLSIELEWCGIEIIKPRTNAAIEFKRSYGR